MKLSRRFWLTLAAVFALAIGSGGGWALAQDNEGGGGESHATEPAGDDSATPAESEGGEGAESSEPAGDDQATESSSEETAPVAEPTESAATFTG